MNNGISRRCLNCGKEAQSQDVLCASCNTSVPTHLKQQIEITKKFMRNISDCNPYQEVEKKASPSK